MVLKRYMVAVAAVSVLFVSACGEELERLLIPIPDESTEATLVDFTSGPVTEPSAFDLIVGDAVRTDQSASWDFLLDFPDGKPVLWPRSAIIEEDSDSGVQQSARTFDGLVEAPESGYVQIESVPLRVGDVLVVRSRRDPAFGNVRCRRFAKLEVLGIDSAERTMTFRHLVNPNCEKRTLVPGAEE